MCHDWPKYDLNINNGAIKRLSGIATAIFLICFIMFASKWIEMIPLAALIGVMFVVAEKTFEWGTLRLFGKVPKQDIFVGLLVGAVIFIADLALRSLSWSNIVRINFCMGAC